MDMPVCDEFDSVTCTLPDEAEVAFKVRAVRALVAEARGAADAAVQDMLDVLADAATGPSDR